MQNEVSPRLAIFVFVLVLIMIVAGAVLILLSRPEPVQITINPPLPTGTLVPTHTPSPILVYVTGAVQNPETTVTLPYGSRVSDVIAAAGGTTGAANLAAVNLAAIVHDGDQVHVPSLNESANAISPLPTRSGGNLVYINQATLDELQTLPGVGAVLAQRIIDYRTTNGAFTSLADLDNVNGIGEALLRDLEGLISFD